MRCLFWKRFDFDQNEASVSASLCNMLVTVTTALALINESWMTLEPRREPLRHQLLPTNKSVAFESMAFNTWPIANGRACSHIGTRQFWYPARFGSFSDQFGHMHTSFHYNNIVVVDCITPGVANLFYLVISLSFIGLFVSFCAGLLTLLAPARGFLLWLRRNMVLELLALLLLSLALMVAVIGQYQVTGMQKGALVRVGPGMYLITMAAMFMFASIGCSIRHHNTLRQIHRIENKRFICSRALRSWRDYSRRPEDTRPIITDQFADDEPILAFTEQYCQEREQPVHRPIDTENVNAAP